MRGSITRSLLAVTAVPAAVLIPAVAAGQEVSPQTQEPTVVKTDRQYPAKVRLIRGTFRPPAYPSPRGVLEIIDQEARRVGASADHLRARVACETGRIFGWWQTNGQYAGVGQFSESTFRRGMASLDTRVVWRTTRTQHARHVRLVDVYSDGSTRERRGWRVRQLVVHRDRGVIPRWPDRRHVTAQVRIMALAMVGRSRVSDGEWSCR
jgi:hypothetical protein